MSIGTRTRTGIEQTDISIPAAFVEAIEEQLAGAKSSLLRSGAPHDLAKRLVDELRREHLLSPSDAKEAMPVIERGISNAVEEMFAAARDRIRSRFPQDLLMSLVPMVRRRISGS